LVSSDFLTMVEELPPQVEQSDATVQVARLPAVVPDLSGEPAAPQDQEVNSPDVVAEAQAVVADLWAEQLCLQAEVLASLHEQ
jgi:hypothetical protein